MYMTEAEVCREYRQAKDKQAQISILAELNLCTQDEIRALLARNGFLKDLPEKKSAARRNQSRKKGAVSWDTEQARALCEEGRTDREIGETLGVAPSTVCKWRKAEGLPANRKPRKPGPGRTEAPPEVLPNLPKEARPESLPANEVPGKRKRNRACPGEGPVALEVELMGCAFSLRAADLAGAARVYQYAGRILADLVRISEGQKEAAGNEAEQ